VADEDLRQLAQRVINKDKWWDLLSRYIEVIRSNIFIVDTQGLVILPPEKAKYGGQLLTNPLFNFDMLADANNLIGRLKKQGRYFEIENRFGLTSFALPVCVKGNKLIAYVIVGPVILNKRLEIAQYQKIAADYGVPYSELINEINELRVLSNVMMNAILDLLYEIVKNNLELVVIDSGQEALEQKRFSQEFQEVAEEIKSNVRLDELLVSLLDVALKMTDTECGSVMIVDENGDLTIKVSRGLKPEREASHVKLGEGIAGLAAKENRSFLIRGQQGENRLKSLLNRPEIKDAIVMPLLTRNRVFGVLNLHTMKEENKIRDNFDNLQYLSKLMSSVF